MTTPAPAAPHPNSYWLPGCRIIAGEYPYSYNPAAGPERLRPLLDAGVTHFIDLTERGELNAYEPALRAEAERRGIEVHYVRLPIRDMGVPSPSRMTEILDALDDACAAGGTAYVHCWGGVGRTGTVVGCYLVRRGMAGDDALARVGELFATMSPAKCVRFPEGSPQTPRQKAFVRGWREEARSGGGGNGGDGA